MEQKKNYIAPQTDTVQLSNDRQLMAGSEVAAGGPSADFMADPDIE